MSRPRKIKNVSFADTVYERELLAHASQPQNGPFSVYVKRLIEQDRAGVVKLTVHADAARGVNHVQQTPSKPDTTQKDREASRSFL